MPFIIFSYDVLTRYNVAPENIRGQCYDEQRFEVTERVIMVIPHETETFPGIQEAGHLVIKALEWHCSESKFLELSEAMIEHVSNMTIVHHNLRPL